MWRLLQGRAPFEATDWPIPLCFLLGLGESRFIQCENIIFAGHKKEKEKELTLIKKRVLEIS